MIGMKEICALLLAGGMGAGSVVAVQKAKPAISKPKAKKAHKSAERTVRNVQLNDCPAPTAAPAVGIADLGPLLDLQPLQPELLTGSRLASLADYGSLPLPPILGGGGGSTPSILPTPPAPGVPQPDTWVLMVAGFGFIGLALRRPRKQPAAREA